MRRKRSDHPLNRDVDLLGRMLGEVLIEQQGRALFDLEERIRKLAIRRRRGRRPLRPLAQRRLQGVLARVPPAQAEPLIRAFDVYFQLVNVAEQHHWIRLERASGARDDSAEGTLVSAMLAARKAGVTAEEARRAISRFKLTLTFTAHPTQAVRRTILEKLYGIAQLLDERERCPGNAEEQAQAQAALREQVTLLWQTDLLRHERPVVADEVKNIAFYIETSLRNANARALKALAAAFERAWGEPLGVEATPVRIRSWAGGDMDGNPSVTPEVVEDAIRAYEIRGLRQLIEEVEQLGVTLSQSTRQVPAPRALLASLEDDSRRMPWIAERLRARIENEPWRGKLRFIEARLRARIADVQRLREAAFPPGPNLDPVVEIPDRWRVSTTAAELASDLEVLADSLRECCGSAGERRVRDLLARVRSRGLHLAELEVRAGAEEVRGAAEVARGTAAPGGNRILGALERIARAQRESGETACRTLILSMTSRAEDLFAALACARAAGLSDDARGVARIDIVPLFETLEALRDGPAIMREVLADASYRRHALARGAQEVMVGYSDSGKLVGLLAASAALRRAQLELLEVGREQGVPIHFFHGRGETVARGGGPSQQAVLALPPGAVGGHFKVTEQGEALDHKYARPELARRNVEMYLAGALLHSLGLQPRPPAKLEARFEEAFDAIAESGRRAYRALVWEEPLFVEFFESATPVKAFANLNIGSRPTKRGAGGLDALRAIPWVFAWNQNRAILPGWYGVGEALEKEASTRGGAKRLHTMYARWPFFRSVIDNVEMVLAKTDLDIAARYANLASERSRRAVWPRIVEEHARTTAWVRRITGHKRLLDGNPALQRSIELRNPYVDPISYFQIELLGRQCSGVPGCERPLLLTIGGIAAGLRNTG